MKNLNKIKPQMILTLEFVNMLINQIKPISIIIFKISNNNYNYNNKNSSRQNKINNNNNNNYNLILLLLI